MARLTAAERRKLPDSDFADPKDRAYPMEDADHAKAAQMLVKAHGTPAQKAEVAAKASKKRPLASVHA
jgi:hypothetical protein